VEQGRIRGDAPTWLFEPDHNPPGAVDQALINIVVDAEHDLSPNSEIGLHRGRIFGQIFQSLVVGNTVADERVAVLPTLSGQFPQLLLVLAVHVLVPAVELGWNDSVFDWKCDIASTFQDTVIVLGQLLLR